MRRPGYTNEYYMVENRQKVDRDASVADDGLAIWHIDRNGDNSWNQMTEQYHYLVTLVQADGDWDLEHGRNQGDATDLYAAPTYTSCTPETDPDTDWWDGSESGHAVTNISGSGMTMTFDYGDLPPSAPTGLAATAGELSVSLQWDVSTAADFDFFVVERDTTAAFGAGTFSDTTEATGYVDGPLEAGVEQYYRVSAVDLGGNIGDPCAAVSCVPLGDVPPSFPTDLAALGGGDTIELRWQAGPEVDVVGYHVLRDSTLAFAVPETVGFAAASPFTDATVAPGSSRWYRVVAEDAAGHRSVWTPAVCGVAVSGDAIYVDASNSGPAFGTFEQPYPDLGSGMDDASSGDVVVVYPGVYDESVIMEQGVSLVGMRGADSTSVTAGLTALGSGSDVVLKGLTVDGGGSTSVGLNCVNARFTIEDCAFENMAGEGVSCSTGGAPLIRRVVFDSNARAVTCSDSSAPIIESCTFSSNTLAHVFTSGTPGPTIGGTLDTANDFAAHGLFAVWNTGPSTVAAELNYWGDDCVDPAWFSGSVDYTPWTDATHTQVFDGCWSDVPEGDVPTAAYALPARPNPLSPGTNIAFGLPDPGGRVTLRIYDVAGRLVRSIAGDVPRGGNHNIYWDGRDSRGHEVPSGVYFYRLEAPGLEAQGKSVVVR